MTTSNAYLAAWLDSAGLLCRHVDRESSPWRFYFHDSDKLREAEREWRRWTGGNFRKSYKRLTNRDL